MDADSSPTVGHTRARPLNPGICDRIHIGVFPVILLALVLSCTPRSRTTPQHLILITIDTLRADHTSLVGYARETTPELKALAEGGANFTRAIAQWPKTGTSFASMFSGLYPQTTGLTHRAALKLPEDLDTLPGRLKEQGFRNVAVISNPVLSQELGWDRHFDEYLETWSDVESDDPFVYRPQLSARRVNTLASDLLERNRSEERLFVWIHYSDPHAPYVLPNAAPNPFGGDDIYEQSSDIVPDLTGTRGRAIPGVTHLRDYVSLYDANVLESDRAIGELLRRLEALELLSDAAVVVTADHGESLGEKRLFFEHGPLPHNPGVHVPLILTGPGIKPGQRIGSALGLIHLLPTVCEWLQIPCPDSIDGTSLWPILTDSKSTPSESSPRLAFSEAGHRPDHFRTVQNKRFKLVYFTKRRSEFPDPEGRFELYDLAQDPAEKTDVQSEYPEELRQLQRALVTWIARAGQPNTGDDSPLTPAEKRGLDAMGYNH